MQNALAFCGNKAADYLLCDILGAVAQQVLEFFGVELFNNFLLPLDDIRVLLWEDIQPALVLEKHLQEASSPFQHLVQPVLEAQLERSLLSLFLLVS